MKHSLRLFRETIAGYTGWTWLCDCHATGTVLTTESLALCHGMMHLEIEDAL